MRYATRAFRQALLDDQRDYINRATVTLADGTVLELDNTKIWVNGLETEDAVSADNVFQIGGAVIGQGKLVINNIYDAYSAYDFDGAKVVMFTGLEIDGAPEEIKMGTFTVDEAEYNGSTITLVCLDNLAKFDKAYDTNLVYPATLQEIVLDAYTNCLGSAAMGDTTFPHYQYEVAEKPSAESTTYRQVLAWVAQISGRFVRCDADGKIRFGWYNTAALDELREGLDGGYFDGGQSILSKVSGYLNTTNGMTTITTSSVDSRWFSVENEIGFEWNGTASSRIYIDSDSCFYFGETAPSNHGKTQLRDINLFTRDGLVSRLYSQVIEGDTWSAIKIRFYGYTRPGTYTNARMEYEIFFMNDGKILINFIQIPSSSTYLGTTSIVENGVSTAFTPAVGAIQAYRSGGAWVTGSAASYQSGDTADGGSFNPWDTGYTFDAGSFADAKGVHIIASAYSNSLSTDDVVITGTRVVKKIESDSASDSYETYNSGTTGYVVSVEGNDLIQGDHGQDIANWLGAALIGLTFRKAEITHPSDPCIEAGDVAIFFDRKGNPYSLIVSSTTFTSGNSQRTVSSAETPRKNSSQRFSNDTKNYVDMRKQLQEEKTERELAEAALRQQISSSAGLYLRTETDATTGATKYYLHNKQNFNDSNIRILFSTAGISVTANYGATWYGLTADGDMLTHLLSTVGISFSWARGGTLTLGGSNNENGVLRILNSSGTQIATINKDGINVSNGKFVVDTNGNVTAMSLAAYGSFICYESYTIS